MENRILGLKFRMHMKCNYKAKYLIWYLNETMTIRKCFKLQTLWSGPYIITKKKSGVNFEIQINAKGQNKIIPHDKMKPIYS